MSIFICEICDKQRDADFVGCHEWGEGLACEPCYDEEFEKQKAQHKPLYDAEKKAGLLPDNHYSEEEIAIREQGLKDRKDCYACATQRYSCEHD